MKFKVGDRLKITDSGFWNPRFLEEALGEKATVKEVRNYNLVIKFDRPITWWPDGRSRAGKVTTTTLISRDNGIELLNEKIMLIFPHKEGVGNV